MSVPNHRKARNMPAPRDNNEQAPLGDADEQYVLIDKVQQQTINDAEGISNDLKPLAELLKKSPGLLHALLEPSDYDLYRAIYEGRPQLAAELVKQGRNVDFADIHNHDNTCLHLAARSSDSRLIKSLLAAKPSLDPTNAQGVTPLMLAAIHGNVENVIALLEAGADKEIALESRHALDALLDIDETITTGSTALLLAAQHGHAEVVRALAAHGAELDVQTDRGFTPLHACILAGSVECVSAILDAADDESRLESLEAETDGYFTPLIYAANGGFEDIARLLLDKGADIEHAKSLYMTPLLEACWTEEASMVDFLISRGADIEATTDDFNDDIEHFTPLMLAAKFDVVQIASSLIAAGADKAATSGAGETAAEIAENNGSSSVLELLVQN